MKKINGFDYPGAPSPALVARVVREAFRSNEESAVAIGMNLTEAVHAVIACRETDGESEQNADIIAFLDKELRCHVFNFSPSRKDVCLGDVCESEIQCSHSYDDVQISLFEVEVLPMEHRRLPGRKGAWISSIVFDLSDFSSLSISALREGRQHLCLTLTINGKAKQLTAFTVFGDAS